MFLDYQFCEDNDVRIEKMHHLSTLISSDRRSDVDELMHDLDGCQTQFHITERTKELADFLDSAYEQKLPDYAIKNELFNKGFHKGIVLETTVFKQGQIGRPILYIYAESELEVKAFMEEVSNIVWGE
ncbi:hypothetical protein KNV09_gp078 [Vibrio phage Athena]|uniref:Uncharacterized protein n=6 Tax=Thalassavirus TaxID=2948922 RepID=A0A4Y6E7R3_9CAUD|nr:hypothetical protein KNU52_gp075 [Vibrio phage Achelous]YP_010102509.1 hypothetical protein KNU58_gp069 [Vibrio phage Brizo]YP_010102696.1 hypothetical protein KNU59_gp075 [Vibrio phage Pontus]YP_010108315.1 hypothetical protein KNV07_gp079 [Vibrio phage Cody]YP_010108703.1 hypothetical protein KNV09_gp078 [Vibrio phage Athena]YP_010114252.1 hypothetical protein KNV71_gp082 [Vibrio phage Gary]QIG66393.1 hypothetical protein CHAZLY21_80 [Vibrio phage Chazly21]QQO89716.1 hypothetical protei